LKAAKEVISHIELALSVNNGPGILLKLKGLCVRESPALVLTPVPLLSPGIEYLAMEELLGLDDSEVFLDLDLPLAEDVGFSEMLDQVVDAVVSVAGLSDHMASKIPHLVGILSEVLRKGSFVAARWD